MAPKAAAPAAASANRTAKLPLLVTTPADLGRLERELGLIDESLLQLGLRHGGTETKMPKTSKLMDELIQLNGLNLLRQADRQALYKFLVEVKAKAPVLHISFSADPSPVFLEKLVSWLRQEIHPLVLVTIGLQPNLGAGCVVRSTNKYFDFSLRQDFTKKREMLLGMLVQKEVKA